VVSVFVGWITAEVLFVAEILAAWDTPPLFRRSPLVLVANLFVYFGTHALYTAARSHQQHLPTKPKDPKG